MLIQAARAIPPPPPPSLFFFPQPIPKPSEAESGAASAAAAAGGAPAPVKVDVNSLPIRAYLDQTVVPILLAGMSQLVKEVRGWEGTCFTSYADNFLPPPPIPLLHLAAPGKTDSVAGDLSFEVRPRGNGHSELCDGWDGATASGGSERAVALG